MGNPLPVAPSLEPVLDAVLTPREDEAPNRRTLRISALAIVAAFLAAVAAQLLTRLIGLITNVAFYGRWSAADFLDQVLVREIASTEVVTLPAEEPVEEVRDRIAARTPGSQHQGFPVVNGRGDLVGVVTRRDLLDLDIEITALVGDLVKRPAVVIYDDSSAREAADHMVHERVGRLPVVSRANSRRVIGIVSRSDLLEAHERRLHAHHRVERTIDLAATLAWVRPNER